MSSRWVRFNEPLSSMRARGPEPFVQSFLEEVRADLGRDRGEVSVLDVGCGRGDVVAWLLSEGWDAYGADVEYVEQGSRFIEEQGYGAHRLRLIEDYHLPFEGPFDIVLSNQVLEHIPDIDAFVAGIAKVSRPGTAGLHVCPGAWRPIEPHMKTPLAHYVPKPYRRPAIRAALRLGLANDHFADQPDDERAEIYTEFSRTETFYRSHRALKEAFARHDHEAEAAEAEKLDGRLPLSSLVAPVYGTFWACYLTTSYNPSEYDPVGCEKVLTRAERRRAAGR